MITKANFDEAVARLDRVSSFGEFADWIRANAQVLYTLNCPASKPRKIEIENVKVFDPRWFKDSNAYSTQSGWRLMIEFNVIKLGHGSPILTSIFEHTGIELISGGGSSFFTALCFVPARSVSKLSMIEALRR